MRETEREKHNFPFQLAEAYLDAILIDQLKVIGDLAGVIG
jgi:hypothetical protein